MILWKMSLHTIKKNQRESNAQLHAGGSFAFSGESKEANEQFPDCPHQFFAGDR
jgi:predicted TPR repeat methyltransferase